MNHLYPKGKQHFLQGDVAWLTDTIKICAATSAYVQSDADEFFSAVGGGAQVFIVGGLAGKGSTGGTASANNVTATAVASGSTIAGLIAYKDTGTAGTSPLLAWWDTKADSTPIAVPTNGGDITLAWASLQLFTL